MTLNRFKLTIEYDGRPYCGWQVQDDLPTVQGRLIEAIGNLYKQQSQSDLVFGADLMGAGRTDSGVHATGQVAHTDLPSGQDPFKVMHGINHYLMDSGISIVACEIVPDDFHARFSAIERRYCYRIINRRGPLTFERGLAWHVGVPLDIDKMRLAASYLVGEHDFSSFRSAHCQAKSPVRILDEIRLETHQGDVGQEIKIYLRARSFLHNQVRAIVGSLKKVGEGQWQPEKIKEILLKKDRRAAGPNAVPEGLYLTNVFYPNEGPK